MHGERPPFSIRSSKCTRLFAQLQWHASSVTVLSTQGVAVVSQASEIATDHVYSWVPTVRQRTV